MVVMAAKYSWMSCGAASAVNLCSMLASTRGQADKRRQANTRREAA
jgi:hypothetical protein